MRAGVQVGGILGAVTKTIVVRDDMQCMLEKAGCLELLCSSYSVSSAFTQFVCVYDGVETSP